MLQLRFYQYLTAFIVPGLTLAGSAFAAAEPTSLGAFSDWQAFTYQAKDSRVCYIFASPQKSDAVKKVKRDPMYFLVTHFPGRHVKGQVSTIIGYPFKEGSPVTVRVDDKDYALYTQGDTAWAGAPETETAIVAAMKSGKSLVVTGTSSKGTETKDTYSLAGVAAAMDKIDAICK
jgi:hypothetical protein